MIPGPIKYSKEFTSQIHGNKWIGYEGTPEPGEDPDAIFLQIKSTVHKWANDTGYQEQPVSTTELPTINREHERLRELIEDADTRKTLLSYKEGVDNSLNPDLQILWAKKYSQLNNK